MSTKKTAANTPVLSRIKVTWNAKIYKQASQIFNERGEAGLVAYMQQFTTKPIRSTDDIR